MEASARLVWGSAMPCCRTRNPPGLLLEQAEARENEKNAACFEAIPAWFSCGPTADGLQRLATTGPCSRLAR